MKWWEYMIAGGAVITAILISFWAGRITAHAVPNGEVLRDTVVLVKTDTITRDRPVYVKQTVVDTMFVAVVDTVRIRDSVFIAVEREQRVYEDSLYRAWVSGYRPALDSISIYRRKEYVYVTETVVRPDPIVSLGFSAGYGVAIVSDGGGTVVRPAPTVSAGININLITLFRKRKK